MTYSTGEMSALGRIEPEAFASYLLSKGWTPDRNAPPLSQVWTKRFEERQQTILIPAVRARKDYVRRVAEAVDELATLQGVSPPSVLQEISHVGSDIVRLRFEGSDAADGSIPFAVIPEVAKGAKDAVMAAARAAENPRPAFKGRKSVDVQNLEKSLRLGQTELGSYVFTILAPLTFERPETPLGLVLEQVPLARRATTLLSRATQLAVVAAEEAEPSGRIRNAKGFVDHGVSSNLCLGLSRLSPKAETLAPSISFVWSEILERVRDVPENVRIPPTAIASLRMVSKFLAERAIPEEPGWHVGHVIGLFRRVGENRGQVRITTSVQNRDVVVAIDLEADWYSQALDAHKRVLPVRFQGVIRRRGVRYVCERLDGFETEAVPPRSG